MDAPNQAELVVLHLREWSDWEEGDEAPYAVSTPGIGDALGLSHERMAEWMGLMSTLSGLTDDGHVTERVCRAEGGSDERAVYALTESGERMAEDCFERLVDETITVHEAGTERELSLQAIPAEYPDLTMAEALARRSPDGTLYLSANVDDGIIGREPEREQLRSLLSAVESGDSRVAFVTGEQDIGKTRLVEAVLEEAHERGIEVLAGSCEADVAEPYHPIVDAFSRNEPAGIDGLAAFERQRVVVDDADEYTAQRAALHHQLVQAVVGDAETPRILFIDNVHLTDHATADFLSSLLDALDAESLGVILTAHLDANLDASVGSTLMDRHLDAGACIELEPLAAEETRLLIETIVGKRGVPDAFVDLVQKTTGGVPLYVEQLVTQLREDGLADPVTDRYPTSEADIDLPAGLTATAERRLDGLDAISREVLEAAAVCGEYCEFDLLESVVDHPSAAVRGRIDLLIRTGVLTSHRDGIRFVSTLYRETVLETAPDRRLQAFHERVAETLRAQASEPGDGELPRVAYHHDCAGNREQAVEWYRRAAEAAREVYAHDEAVEYYTEALELAREIPGHDEDILAIIESIGSIYSIRGDFEQVRKYFEYVLERTTDPERQRRAYQILSRIELPMGNPDQALEYAETGLAVDGPSPSRQEAWLWGRKGHAFKFQSRFSEAEENFSEMKRIAERLDASDIAADACRMIGWMRSQLGDQDGAIESLERGIEHVERADNDYRLVMIYCTFGSVLPRKGAVDRGIRYQERAVELADEIGATQVLRMLMNSLGLNYERKGMWENALECHEETIEIARTTNDLEFESTGLSNSAWVFFHTGSLSMARERYEAAIAISHEIDEQYFLTWQLARLGRVLLYQAAFDEAMEVVDEALSIGEANEIVGQVGVAHGVRGELLRERGDVDASLASFEASISIARVDGPVQQLLDGLAGYALTSLEANRSRRALEHAAAAVDHPRSGEFGFEARRARLAEASCLRACGAFDVAEARLETLLAETVEGSNILECETRIELGNLVCDRDDHEPGESHAETAREHFESAHELATEIGAQLLVDKSRDGLGRLDT